MDTKSKRQSPIGVGRLRGSVGAIQPVTLVLRRKELVKLMNPAAYLAAVEVGFRALADGDTLAPMPMHIPLRGGGFHGKGAFLLLDRPYVVMKVNGNFPCNPDRLGLPTIQGVVLLFDASNGALLAVMDSMEITLRRTGAASALAARYLARADASSIAICGCGEQGRAQLEALAEVVPLKRALAWDVDLSKAREFARNIQEIVGIEVSAVKHLVDATLSSDIVVAATSAHVPFLTKSSVQAGTFIAAVGADSPHKSELAPELLAGSKIVVDLLSQCVAMGDLHHALDAGAVTTADVHAELADLVVGRKRGRTDTKEITVFDSTGVAIQDAASAAWIYQRALSRNIGTPISFAAL